MRYCLYIFLTISFCFIVVSTDPPNNDTAFVPTTEWQTLKKGTPIPKGLHVRHNFQTGITEVKLMESDDPGENTNNYTDADDETPKSLTLHPYANELNTSEYDKTNISTTDKLRTILKNIKSNRKKDSSPFATKVEEEKSRDNVNDSDDESANINGSGNFGKLTKSPDFEFLNIFIEQFDVYRDAIVSGSLNDEETKVIVDMLSQLEYLVHDIDNGLEFVKFGGLAKVINPCLDGTIQEIKLEALRVLGATVQLNPKVKDAALELDITEKILHALRARSSNTRLSDRYLFALSSLIRNYPTGQKVFLDHGGLEILSTILEEKGKADNGGEVRGQLSTEKRIIDLINDLMAERQELDKIDDTSVEDRDIKIQRYVGVELEAEMIRNIELCRNIGSLLLKTTRREIDNDIDKVDNDLLETIYQCAINVGEICKSEFKSKENEILIALNNIISYYDVIKQRRGNSDDNDYDYNYDSLLTIVKKFKEIIIENTSHDEL